MYSGGKGWGGGVVAPDLNLCTPDLAVGALYSQTVVLFR